MSEAAWLPPASDPFARFAETCLSARAFEEGFFQARAARERELSERYHPIRAQSPRERLKRRDERLRRRALGKRRSPGQTGSGQGLPQ